MQKGLCYIVLIFAFLSAGQVHGQPSPSLHKSTPPPSQSSTGYIHLENGLGVEIIPDQEVPVIWIEMSFQAGTAYETDEELGISHLFAKSVSWIPRLPVSQLEPEDQMLLQYPFDAYTSPEKLSFNILIPPDQFNEGLEVLRNRVLYSPFEGGRMKAAKHEVIQSFGRVNTDPFRNIKKILFIRLYGPDAAIRFPEGDVQAISGMRSNDLEQFRLRFLQPGNCLLSVKGAIPEDGVLDKIRGILGEWSGYGEIPEARKPRPYTPATEEATPLSHESISIPIMFAAWRGPDARENTLKEALCASLFCKMGNYPLSKLQRELVTNGPVQQAAFDFDLSLISNPISVSLFGLPGQEKACMKEWFRMLDLLENGTLFSTSELKRARAELVNDLQQIADVPREDLKSLSFWWALGGPGFREKLPKVLNSISITDINRFADDYILTQAYSAALLGPSELVNKTDIQDLFGLPEVKASDLVVSSPDNSGEAEEEKAAIPVSHSTIELNNYRVFFELNSYVPDQPSKLQLEELAALLTAEKGLNIYIDGHADTRGNADYNKILSERRANAIQKLLIEQYGISPERLTVRAFGESYPVVAEKSIEDLRTNRRVEFHPFDAQARYYED